MSTLKSYLGLLVVAAILLGFSFRIEVMAYAFSLSLNTSVAASAEEMALISSYKKIPSTSLPNGLYVTESNDDELNASMSLSVFFDSVAGRYTETMSTTIKDSYVNALEFTATANYEVVGSVIMPTYVSGKRGMIFEEGVSFKIDSDGNLITFFMKDGNKGSMLFKKVTSDEW
jgi:hypothetical protein